MIVLLSGAVIMLLLLALRAEIHFDSNRFANSFCPLDRHGPGRAVSLHSNNGAIELLEPLLLDQTTVYRPIMIRMLFLLSPVGQFFSSSLGEGALSPGVLISGCSSPA